MPRSATRSKRKVKRSNKAKKGFKKVRFTKKARSSLGAMYEVYEEKGTNETDSLLQEIQSYQQNKFEYGGGKL